jgi:hypothetical protein
MHRPSFLVIALLGLAILGPGRSPLAAAPHDARGVTLLLQGAGPMISSKAGEETWGEYLPAADGRLHWTGFIGYLAHQHGWSIGGVIRPRAEQVLPAHLDTLGAAPADRADVYLLASSLPAQTDGLDSRARELASAVGMLRSLTGARQIRLVAYSASGVAARVWMQGGLENQPYPPGSVAHLICVAAPHLGIGALARPAAFVAPRYGPLAPDSLVLSRINRELDLPCDVRYTDLVIQGFATPWADSGRIYLPYLRLPEPQIDAMPPLLRQGHDGVVHALSAQLRLTLAAARYENQTNRPVQVVVCQPRSRQPDDVRDLTLHTLALGDQTVWETLRAILDRPSGDEDGPQTGDAAATPSEWARQTARHLAATAVQRRHPTGRIGAVGIARCEITAQGRNRLRCAWQGACEITVPRLFRDPDFKTCDVMGSFVMDLDRFQRPAALQELAVEVGDR